MFTKTKSQETSLLKESHFFHIAYKRQLGPGADPLPGEVSCSEE